MEKLGGRVARRGRLTLGLRQLDLSDELWATLCGGYGLPYDPRKALRAIESDVGTQAAWRELWTELYHQGDVGEASYATVPMLARLVEHRTSSDENLFALAATIEEARLDEKNPPLPIWLAEDYTAAWQVLCAAAITALTEAENETAIGSLVAVIATYTKQYMLAQLALKFSETERGEFLRAAVWLR